MRRGASIVLPVILALVTGLVLAPTAALADRSHGRPVAGRGLVGGRPVVARPFVHHRPVRHRTFRRPFFHRPVIPFAVISSSVVVYAPPPAFYGPPAYYEPPAKYDPPAAYAPSAGYGPVAPAPTPSVIEYPTGRYELRGDGMATPYTWVWIPNPPPPPPPGPPPEVSAPAAPTPSGDRSPARRTQLYRWTDTQGVEHWTDRGDLVPERYRSQAKRPEPS